MNIPKSKEECIKDVSCHPDLFNLYSEMILCETEDLKGFIIGGQNINDLMICR